jgi:sortase A
MIQKLRTTSLLKIRLPKSPNYFRIAGVALVAVSVILFALIFSPVITSEVRYAFDLNKSKQVISRQQAQTEYANPSSVLIPMDEEFGIVIPKIEANAKIIPNVDVENSVAYQRALTQGVAQAAGSANPGEDGNVFIFAHSGQDFLEANRYNAVFYLLSKLEKGDEIDIFYQKQKFQYLVTGKYTAFPAEVGYMDNTLGKKTLTLMTCWPGGTTLKRLIVRAEQN